jgi:DNA-binding SARP family transcriptional activator
MLAALALRVNQPVPIDHLIDAVWGVGPPRTCRDQIHNGVVRLRRVLISHAQVRLCRAGEGYRLEIDPDRIDAYIFASDVARARQLASAGDTAGAVAASRAGLDLWYGDALDGAADGALAPEAARLNEMRLSASEDLFAHEIALGNGSSVASEIAALAARHPLRERLVWLLMTALIRTGRSAEALGVFRDHRHRMVHELGVEPDRALRDLELEILQGARPDLTGRTGSSGRTVEPRQAELATMLTELARLADEVARRLRGISLPAPTGRVPGGSKRPGR